MSSVQIQGDVRRSWQIMTLNGVLQLPSVVQSMSCLHGPLASYLIARKKCTILQG